MLNFLKKESNKTATENGALTYKTTYSSCLDLFSTIGALRAASEQDIIKRFIRAFAEDADLATKILFYARDIRGGLGERRVFRIIFRHLAINEPSTVKKNIENVGEYGRFDDLLSILGTPCENDAIDYFGRVLKEDMKAADEGRNISLLAKWLPSINASNEATVSAAKTIARGIGISEAQYRKMLSRLRRQYPLMENHLRVRDYTFDYEHQPSKALYKYRKAFIRNDEERYQAFIKRAEKDASILNTKTLTPYDVIAPIIEAIMRGNGIPDHEREAINATWNSLEDYTEADNSLVVVDGSGSMYSWSKPIPAAVAQSLAIYFAERNKGAFHNHFITFSQNPSLVEIKGRDIAEKVRYCMGYNEVSNTDLAKTFELLLSTAVNNHLPSIEMPDKLYIISDMEFDYCASNRDVTNFEYAKEIFEKNGYRLPQVIFWNVQSRNIQQPVTQNEQGVALVSGCSPQVFSMIKEGDLSPMSFMMRVLESSRYRSIVA